MKDPNPAHRHELALFRYGLIADLVPLPPGTKGLYQCLEEKAATEYTIPGTTRTRVAAETLRDWLRRLRRIDAQAARRPRPLPGAACGGGRLLAVDQAGQPEAVRAAPQSRRPAPRAKCRMNSLCRRPLSTACWSAMA